MRRRGQARWPWSTVRPEGPAQRLEPQPPDRGSGRALPLDLEPLAARMRAEATSTHRELFTAGTSKADQSRLSLRLSQIVRAQAAIADGSYGSCSSCGLDIELNRLVAQPTARDCEPCHRKPPSRRASLRVAPRTAL